MNTALHRLKKPLIILLSLLFWFLLWQVLALVLDVPLILPAPRRVFRALGALLGTSAFWSALGTSILHIYSGCLVGLIIGFIFGLLTWRSKTLDIVFTPVFSVIRSTPVACFIVLIWVFVGGKNLPFFISLLMVAPVMMTGTQTGLRATPATLLEAAHIYHLSPIKTVRTCYVPAVLPHAVSAIVNCIGLAWKAGIAAEIIVRVEGTVGYAIWEAKSWNIDSADLFAWTLAVIVISLLFEFLFKRITKKTREAVSA